MPEQYFHPLALQLLNLVNQLLKPNPINHIPSRRSLPPVRLSLNNPFRHASHQVLRISLDHNRTQLPAKLLIKDLPRDPQTVQSGAELSNLIRVDQRQSTRGVVRRVIANEDAEGGAWDGVLTSVRSTGSVDGDDDLVYVGDETTASLALRENLAARVDQVASINFDQSGINVATVDLFGLKRRSG
jgi:hypothetical protein